MQQRAPLKCGAIPSHDLTWAACVPACRTLPVREGEGPARAGQQRQRSTAKGREQEAAARQTCLLHACLACSYLHCYHHTAPRLVLAGSGWLHQGQSSPRGCVSARAEAGLHCMFAQGAEPPAAAGQQRSVKIGRERPRRGQSRTQLQGQRAGQPSSTRSATTAGWRRRGPAWPWPLPGRLCWRCAWCKGEAPSEQGSARSGPASAAAAGWGS